MTLCQSLFVPKGGAGLGGSPKEAAYSNLISPNLAIFRVKIFLGLVGLRAKRPPPPSKQRLLCAVGPVSAFALLFLLPGFLLLISTEADDLGKREVIDLKPDGRNVPVTNENKQEFVTLITDYKMTKAIKDQIDAFLGGFYEIVPRRLISIFNEHEVCVCVCVCV